jgi:hypothetical protein
VVDDECHQLDRILADDVVDALVSGDDRVHVIVGLLDPLCACLPIGDG